MAEYRTLKMTLWSDPFIESLSASGKLLYLYLITSPHTNNLGLLEVTYRRMAMETGLDEKIIHQEMKVLEDAGKLIVAGGIIWLTKFIANQTSCSPKMVIALRRQLERVRPKKLANAIQDYYPLLFEDEKKAEN